MASVTYQSNNSTGVIAGSTTLTINAPTGITVGDLLIAHINALPTTTFTPPSGWTLLSTVTGVATFLYGKIANSADAAAVSFTFTANASTNMRGAMSRFSTVDIISIGDILVNSAYTFNTNTPVTPGITPLYNGLYAIFVSYTQGASPRSVSGYAIANNNPAVWTEPYDLSSGTTSGAYSLTMAYAQSTVAAATGNATATISVTVTDTAIFILQIPSQTNIFPTTQTIASSVPKPTIWVVLMTRLQILSSVGVPTISEIVTKAWSNITKHSSTWTNRIKSAFVPPPVVTGLVQALVVAGGGGGGGWTAGGGAGGWATYDPTHTVSVGSYPITVGTGGVGGTGFTEPASIGANGGNSVFDTITSQGGGGGNYNLGQSGGNGGGGGASAMNPGGSGTQGFAGGSGSSTTNGGGGGAGSGAVGSNSVLNNVGGAGGAGISNSITGTAVSYAGGGGGSAGTTGGAGGVGGGGAGNGGGGSGTAGTANTGGGGGGAYGGAGTNFGGTGGSGVVIIAYPTGTLTATGGTITTSGGNTIHKFTSSGTWTVTSIP